MRTLLIAVAAMFVFAAGTAEAAAPQEEAPVDVGAAQAVREWREANCPRRTTARGAMSGARACRTAGFSSLRNCTYEIDVRASAIRFATGRRRHTRIANCAPARLDA